MKRTTIILILLSLLFPILSFGQTPVSAPENLKEVKQLGEKALEVVEKEGPGIIVKIWQDEVLPVWKKMFDWTKTHIWQARLKPWLENIWKSILRILRIEVEKRKSDVKEEFQVEKKEIKQEAPQVGRSLWEKFKELIK